MATAEASICNKALARIGVKAFIDSLETDQSEEAEVARLFYEDERDSLLMKAPWPFATRRAQLSEVDYAVEPKRMGWQRAYRAPPDLLEPLYVWPGGVIASLDSPSDAPLASTYLNTVAQNPRAPRADQRIPYAVEAAAKDDTSLILCDYAMIVLAYTSQVTDVSRFSALFTDALAWSLASIFAMPLAIKLDVQQLCEKRAQESINTAIARHFQGQQEDMPSDSEMILARR